MKTLLAVLAGIVTLSWGWDAFHAVAPASAHPLWIARQQALYLSGLLSIALMSLAMLLATRPPWLETPLGGMDRVYRTHKWAGILAISFAALHWLIEMTDDILKATIGRAGRLPKAEDSGLLDAMRHLAKDMGEWAIYALLAMLAITLWKRFPYRPWRFVHRAMPVLYLMLAFHSVLLAPTGYWWQPTGWLLALLLATGSYGALHALRGSIGKQRSTNGQIVSVTQTAADICSVDCQLEQQGLWRGHRAGQFAFVTFDASEGPHPFTIASADRGDGRLRFEIKALGDYTRKLPGRLQPGMRIRIEGPYGRFDLARCNTQARQIWIAGGIGITPFLAWLESLQSEKRAAQVQADLHYCTRNAADDPFVPRLKSLCKTLPGIRLQVHDAHQGANLSAAALGETENAEVWFCGPAGLGKAVRHWLQTLSPASRFHQEAFEMR